MPHASIDVTPTDAACGAVVRGVDLRTPLDDSTTRAIRRAWLAHHVLVFPDQELEDEQLEAFTLRFGPFGVDPFIESLADHPHVIAVHRAADETASIFADTWHADWTFQATPPDGTCLYGIVIPTEGGDTLYANQHAAYEAMPDELKARLDGVMAIHSARAGYGTDGLYGEGDDAVRAMKIISGTDAHATQTHPWVRRHPETGRLGLYSTVGYIAGIEGMDDDAARDLMLEVYRWQTRDEVVYRHRWEPGMLVMWDNRSVLHRATGGYDGHERLLHRTTIGADPSRYLTPGDLTPEPA